MVRTKFARCRCSRRRLALLALVGTVVAAGCSGSDESESAPTGDVPATTATTAPPPADTTDPAPADTTDPAPPDTTAPALPDTTATPSTTEPSTTENVRINELQVIGSHNSYHLAPEGAVRAGLEAIVPDFAASLDYTHRPLTEQLEQFGLRQLEIDVYADPDGGRYASRQGLTVVGEPAESGIPALDEPGFKVLHIQDVDFRTTCLTLIACLTEVEAWSTANPQHIPLHIMIEVKEETIEEIAENGGFELPELGVEWTLPLPMTADLLDGLENEVLSVIDGDRIITPDQVRGDHETLSAAVADNGWPELGESRGKVIVSLLARDATTDLYREGAPALEGRLFFTQAEPGAPDAAVVGLDDPVADAEAIAQALADGALVRTRSDVSTTPDGDTTRRDAALASGAQYVSTDVYDDVGRGFVVRLPDDAVVRCSPVAASELCVDAEPIE